MRLLFVVFSILSFASCSHTKSFECGIKNSGSCQTINEVDKSISAKNKNTRISKGGYYDADGIRVPEKTARVWVAPYVADDIYHEASYIKFVIKPSSWS